MRHRFACGVALTAALVALAAAQPGRAQNQPASQAPGPPPATPPSATQSTPSSSQQATPAATSHGRHTVTVTFDYDFGKTPACTAKITTGCVQQFIAFDISAGVKHASMLFPIALPANPTGVVRGITKTSPLLDFESGRHIISVAAMSPDGHHSRRSLCTTWITIP